MFLIRKLIGMGLINAIALFGVSFFMGASVLSISPTWGFFVVGMVFGLLNTFVRPIVSLLALPFFFLTLGFFFVIINIAFLFLVQMVFGEIFSGFIDFELTTNFVSLIFVSLILSVFNFVLHSFFE